ncbi:cyclic nucleotide-binding domain-containing protein [bacterium]|nr:cyclic nucleotide-binding domain-containing protein [bacterium]
MKTLESILGEHPFFKGLPLEHLETLKGCATNAVFEKNTYLCRENQDADTFYVIRAGRVALETDAPPRGIIPIQTVGAGEILGWSWIIPPHEWRFDGKATELTRVISLDAKCLRDKCEADHHLGFELVKRFSQVMATRLAATRLQLMDIYNIESGKTR